MLDRRLVPAPRGRALQRTTALRPPSTGEPLSASGRGGPSGRWRMLRSRRTRVICARDARPPKTSGCVISPVTKAIRRPMSRQKAVPGARGCQSRVPGPPHQCATRPDQSGPCAWPTCFRASIPRAIARQLRPCLGTRRGIRAAPGELVVLIWRGFWCLRPSQVGISRVTIGGTDHE